MKFLKWLLFILLIFVALLLIIPLFMPGTVKISSNKEIAVSPVQVFYNVATYTNRGLWDPWLENDPSAEWTGESQPGYVGSFYIWNGEKIGTGQERVDSVVFGKYIAANIRFGEDLEGSLVEWNFESTETGTLTTLSFTEKTKYPIERLMLNIYKKSLRSSFDKGLENLKLYLEANPPVLSSLGKIEKGRIAPMFALVIDSNGTMEEMSRQMSDLYGKLIVEMERQGLQMTGAPFCHYLTFDQSSGISEYLIGIPVSGKGKDAGDIKSVSYRPMEVIQAIHRGLYDDLQTSYNKLMDYIALNQLMITGETFEFYLTDPSQEPDITQWQTLIAFPLR
jgi:effector-binding domain-containing protein